MFQNLSSDIVTWGLIFVGWVVVWYQLSSLHTRQDIRQYIEDIEKDLLKLEDLAVTYHTADEKSDRIGLKAKTLLNNLYQKINSMDLLGPHHAALLVSALRQAVTLQNFDTDQFSKQTEDGSLLNEVSDRISSLERELHFNYAKKYLKKRFWY